jgi:WD40 repeat protein
MVERSRRGTMNWHRILVLVSLFLLSAFSRTRAGEAAQVQLLFKLTAPLPQPGARFGETLATVGGDIFVGEPSRHVGDVAFAGRAHLFDGQSGQLKYTLDNPEPYSDDTFGTAIDGGDGYLFVGAPGLEQSAYVFDHSSGALLREMNPPEQPGTSNALFGRGLKYAAGDLLIVDPSFSINFGPQTIGQGYLFAPSNGALRDIVENPEPNHGDVFGVGISLAMFGDKMAIGTIADNSNAGRVWVIDRKTAEPVCAIDNPRPDTPGPLNLLDFFAWSVAANESVIVVGSNEDDSSGVEGSGTVFVFDSDTGGLLHTLFSPQLESNGEFGRSVAVTPHGDILVGAWGTTVDGIEGAGRVYLFDGSTGNLLLDIPNPEPSEFAQFGWSVGSIGDRLIVGAMSANGTTDGELLPATGAVYVFAIPEPYTASLALTILFFGISTRRISHANRRAQRKQPARL